MQMNRCFEIVYLLLERKKITAQELADRFEVSVRTIYRDLDFLSQAGIPIYARRGKDGGIELWDTFVLNKTVFSEAEKQELTALLEGLRSTGVQEETQVLQKVSALLGQPRQSWIEADFSLWSKTADQPDLFSLLRHAICNRRRIQFDYYGLNREATHRIVEPLRLVFKAQAWYCYGWCTLREEERFFKIVRMREVVELDESFEPRPLPDTILTPLPDSEKSVTITMKVQPQGIARLMDDFQQIELKSTPEMTTARFTCPDSEWLLSYLLSMADCTEVLAPDDVREKMRRCILALAEQYNKEAELE
ncbi:helix-turn-helix transcriptional regulator [Holdemania filiformis]|uniref:helix-turn-helix transcriptional regulator n=1 Tax=Holdemania filiformis TaxID=61171 RepID=UPI002674541B|nr:YafY family protein [Holdemania filiformis]